MQNKKTKLNFPGYIPVSDIDDDECSFLLDNSLDVIWEMNKKLVFTYASPSIYDTLGYTQEEWVGSKLSEHATFQEFIRMARKALVALKNYKEFNYIMFEADFFHKKGHIMRFEILSRIKYNKKGIPIGLIGSTRNISERKQIEDNLRKSESALKELNNAKDRFFSIIAHDLRNPFNALLGFGELLEEEVKNDGNEKLKEISLLLNQSLKNTFNLVDNLLGWSRIQLNTFKLDLGYFNLCDEINVCLNELNLQAHYKAIKLENSCSCDLIVFADRNIVGIILRNLICNAIKFTQSGGEVKVFVNGGERCIRCMVSDNGIGMSEEKVRTLFKQEESVSHLGTNSEYGTGLGLILCKELIEKHNGKIGVSSELGIGTNFWFDIPVENLN